MNQTPTKDSSASQPTAPVPAGRSQERPAPVEPKDPLREIVETIVFVVFLVLLLKAFIADAFVIPTGSMATTLLGDHVDVTCPQCKLRYRVNAQENNELKHQVDAVCPNCRFEQTINVNDFASSGDKVLILKPQFDLFRPERHETIVFKFPGQPNFLNHRDDDKREGGPQKDWMAYNYIKRLWGLPGEKLGIWYGDVHLWHDKGGKEEMEIIRKSPATMMAMRRIVFDNDHQPADLKGFVPPRWQNEGKPDDWTPDTEGKVFEIQPVNDYRWLGYQHLLWTSPNRPNRIGDQDELARLKKLAAQPTLITDFLDYNFRQPPQQNHWVPDLMLDMEVEVLKAQGELILELVAGIDRYRVVFDLSSGTSSLSFRRRSAGDAVDPGITAATKLRGTGKYRLRFADFDRRLTVWVDGKLAFGDGMELPAPADDQRGPRLADLQPARIGVKNAHVKIRKLQLWRDIYYTREVSGDVSISAEMLSVSADDQKSAIQKELANVKDEPAPGELLSREQIVAHYVRVDKWAPYYFRKVAAQHETHMGGPKNYPIVHPQYHPSDRFGPDEYFALGDNSTQSSDSRVLGQIPERLLLGKAVAVYWPLGRFGLIR